MFTVEQVSSVILDDIDGEFIDGYWFEFYKEGGDWYIIVESPDGSKLYDGWWPNSEDKTLKQAIEEGLKGAELLKQEQE